MIYDLFVKLFSKNKYLIGLLLGYFVLSFTNITLLPIFNDEGIYLDWGIRSVEKPGMLYYSIHDGKTPLTMWLFGIFQNLFSNPLFAGRLVSILFGGISLWGIFRLSRRFFNNRTAIISSILYIFTPIIFFFNRQALMEAGVGAMGIWFAYFYLRKCYVFAGIFGGIGLLIKVNSVITLVAVTLISMYRFVRNKKTSEIKNFGIILAAYMSTSILVLINPDFWRNLTFNSRYGFTISELLHFPISTWIGNATSNTFIIFVFVTPLITIFSIIGLITLRKKYPALVALIILPIIIETLIVKSPIQRYLVSYIPLLVIPAGFMLSKLVDKRKFLGVALLFLTLILPIYLVFLQIFSPPSYFSATKTFPNITDFYYAEGPFSGYAVNQLISKVRKLDDKKILVLIAENAGNPESAINVYLEKDKRIRLGYIQSEYFGPTLPDFDCIVEKSSTPMYFVSRSEYLVGLEKYLTQIDKIQFEKYREFIGIYKFNSDCSKEKTLIVEPVLAP